MTNEKKYFKQLKRSEFINASFFSVVFIILVVLSSIPICRFVKWLIIGSGPFVLFSDCADIVAYCVFVSILLTWQFKNYQCLYRRMQEMPFLTITEKGIHIDKELMTFLVGGGRPDKISLEWSTIQRIEVKKDRLVIFFQKKGEEKSEKIDTRWVDKKESLLITLKTRCEENQITWDKKL